MPSIFLRSAEFSSHNPILSVAFIASSHKFLNSSIIPSIHSDIDAFRTILGRHAAGCSISCSIVMNMQKWYEFVSLSDTLQFSSMMWIPEPSEEAREFSVDENTFVPQILSPLIETKKYFVCTLRVLKLDCPPRLAKEILSLIVDKVRSLEELHLNFDLDDSVLDMIAKCKNLRKLSIDSGFINFSSQAVSRLADSPLRFTLEELVAPEVPKLDFLSSFKKLKSLSLRPLRTRLQITSQDYQLSCLVPLRATLTDVNISFLRIPSGQWIHLAELTELRTLRILNCEGIENLDFLECLACCPHLRELEVTAKSWSLFQREFANDDDDEEETQFQKGSRQFLHHWTAMTNSFSGSNSPPRLETLNLSGCQLLTDDIVENHLTKLTRLTNLDLSCFFSSVSGKGLGKLLNELKNLRSLTVITSVALGRGNIKKGFSEVNVLVPSLETLLASHCGFNSDDLEQISISFPSLRRLELNPNYPGVVDDAGLAVLSRLEKLEDLSLGGMQNVTLITLNCPSLKKLSITFCGAVDDESLRHLCSNHHKNLTGIVLSQLSSVTIEGLHHLAALSFLQELELSSIGENTRGAGGIFFEDVEYNVLPKLKHLSVYSLGGFE